MSPISSILIFTFLTLMVTIYAVSGKVSHLAQLDGNLTNESHSRKLLLQHGACTNRDISVSQSRSETGGIPKFMVEIVNTCVSGCPPSHIYLHCGMFASANLVNPTKFKRVSYDNCLVNGGRQLRTAQLISFTYSNTFKYPLSFKSAKFC